MKNLTIGIGMLLLCCAAKSFSQSFINQPGLLLQKVTDTLQASLSPSDTGEGGGRDLLGSFNAFWSARVYSNDSTLTDSTGSNMFVQYQQALRDAVAARMTAGPCSGSYGGDWQIFGPDSLPTYQRIGKIDAIWADPTDSNFILAGATGGLFETTTGGISWQCITDNALVVSGVTGIGSIAVNPLNRDTLLLGTATVDELGVGMGILQTSSHVGAGILETYNGGNTWQQEFVPITGGFGDTIEVVYGVYFTPSADRVYAFVNDDLYTRSNHPVGNWQKITPPTAYNAGSFINFQFVPGNPNHFFVSSIYYYSGVFEANVTILGDSISSISWSEISDSLPTTTVSGDVITDSDYTRFAISVPGADTLYATGMSVSNPYNTILYKYNISGTTHSWSQWCSAMPTDLTENNPSWLKMQLIVSPANPANIYYGGDILCMSADYGQTFHEIGGYYTNNNHADVRGLCLQTAGSAANGIGDILFTANDGGVGRKSSGVNAISVGVNSMVNINGYGLATGDVWGIGMSYDGTLMVDGEQHDGIMTYEQKQNPAWTSLDNDGDAYTAGFDNAHSAGIVFNNENESASYPYQPMITQPYGSRQLGVSTGISGNDIPDGFINDYNGGNPCIYVDPSGNQYSSMHKLWRLSSDSTTWVDYGTLFSLPDTNETCDMVFSPYDTSLTGYVLYEPNGGTQQLEYRNPSGTGLSNFIPTTAVPGAPTYPMTCVTMDPLHPERVWIGMGGINYNPTSRYRVQYSPNAGTTWYDVSNGLPVRMPVTRIIYQEGSSNVYCATDVGIYVCDFSTFDTSATNYGISWNCFNNAAVSGTGFPNAWVTDMKINYCQGKLYAATYGRGIWASDIAIPWNIVVSGDTITTPTNWTTNHYVTGAIVVDSGVALNFTDDTVFMPRNAAIIVRPGGRLILNHAVVTNECDACMWYGIEAYGNNRLPQNPTNQAWVQIDSGSVVANARYAVSNGDIWDDSAFGGIIQGYQSSFADNHVDASFYPYINTTSPGVVAPDLSYFENCTFSTDNNYKPDALYPFAHHVYMYGVQGIFFTGCQFSNRNDLGSTRGFGEGIMATDAGFSTGVYCPEPYYSLSGCPTPVRTRFSGFATGIDIEDVGGAALTISIDQTDFDTISTGISVATENNVSVTRCNFKVGNGNGVLDVSSMDSTGCEQNIGVLIQNADQFRMEQNTFTGIPIGGGWYNFGAVVANSDANGTQSNMVYRNTFDSLTEGVYAIGCNATGSGTPGSVLATGLEILCNAFSNNTNDIYVANDGNNYGPTHPQGIAKTQEGYSPYYGYVPTENTFTGSTYNIVNNGQVFTYYYDTTGGNQFPTYTGTDTVARYFVPPYGLMCQSTIPAGFSGAAPVAVNPPVLRSYQQAYRNAKAELSDSLTAYNSRIDFGNTTELVSTINASRYGILLYALLAVESPWLSETALDAAADMKLMSYSEFVSILKLNASVFRDPDFRAYIAADYTLTTDDMNTLVSLSAGTNRRTNLESAIMNASLTASIDANTIMMALKVATDTNVSVTDTTGAGICTDPTNVYYGLDSNSYYAGGDSIDTWLQNIGDLWTWYARVGLYNYVHSYTIADSIFTAMSAIVPDNKADQSTYNEYAAIGSVLLPAEIAGRNITQLDSSDIAALDTTSLPFIGYNTAELVLQNITANINLVRTGVLQAPYEVPCMSAGGLSTFRKGNSGDTPITASPITAANSNNANSRFEAYPNPASGIVTFAYYVPDPGENITILITNILGEKVQELQTGNSMGTVYWDASRQPTGVYLYQASDSNGLVSMGKVVIAR